MVHHTTISCVFVFIVFIVSSAVAAPCVSSAQDRRLMIATTTSVDNTGLLDYLAPSIQSDLDLKIEWVAVGTGKARMLGENCDVDVLLVHDPEGEERFIHEGYGVERRPFMTNDFVIIGPVSDPAGIQGSHPFKALAAIAAKRSLFVSRGDSSGTHMKEITLWKSAGFLVPDRESWYVQTGQGMLSTIIIATESKGYTLTDRGTYIMYKSNRKGAPSLVVLVEGDPVLVNRYSVIAVNPQRCTTARFSLALEFINWLTSSKGQKLIGDFQVLGKKPFTPVKSVQ